MVKLSSNQQKKISHRHTAHSRPRQSRSFLEKRRVKAVRYALIASGVIVVLLLVLGFGSRLSFIQVDEVRIVGTGNIENDSLIRETVLNVLSGHYLGIIPKSNLVAIPRSQISESIIEQFPSVMNVDVDVSGIHSVNVVLKERVPESIVCISLPDMESPQIIGNGLACGLIDSTGYIYSRDVALIVSLLDSNRPLKIYFIPSLDTSTTTISTKNLDLIYREFQKIIPRTFAMLVNENQDMELYAYNPDGSLMVVYVSDNEEINEQLSNFFSFWKYMTNQFSLRGQKPAFDYINVRFPPNVSYNMIKQ